MYNPLPLKFVFVIVLLHLFCENASSQGIPSPPPGMIKENLISAELRFLSSAWFEGRKTGERGNEMAADYLELYFHEIGLEPVRWKMPSKFDPRYDNSENTSFYQEVPLFRFTVPKEEPLIVVTRTPTDEKRTEFSSGNDFGRYYAYTSRNVSIHAPVVFAGYGISMPNKGYDDFAGIDVDGKVALVSMGYPGYRDTTSMGYRKMQENKVDDYSRWDKFEAAKKKGAAAVLFLYTTEEWANPTGGDYHNYTYGEKKTETQEPYFELATDSLARETPILTISQRIGHELLQGTGVDLVKFDNKTASDCKPSSRMLKDKSVDLQITKKAELIKSSNIIGCIPGEIPNEFVVVGAHFDHIGKTGDDIYFGCDDNASGAVAVMAIARACKEMKIKPKRTIIFTLWTGEEEGLFGSTYFVDKWNNGKIDFCFNFDMISRYNSRDSLHFLSVSMPKGFNGMQQPIAQANTADSLNLKILFKVKKVSDYGGSDYTPFAEKGIPFCCFFTGFHPDYHEKTDIYRKANMEAMTRIVNLGFNAVWQRANRVE